MNEDVKVFLNGVKNLMRELEWNQSDLARAAGLQTSAVSRWFSGANEPPFSGMVAMAKALGVSVASLLETEASDKKSRSSRDPQLDTLRKALGKDIENILIKAASGNLQLKIPQAHSDLFALLLKLSPQNLGSIQALAEQELEFQNKESASIVDSGLVRRKRNGGGA